VKAISCWEPWAWLIARGWKPCETRTHSGLACLVGQDFAVHAATHWDADGARFLRRWLPPEVLALPMRGEGLTFAGALRSSEGWPRGRVLCVVHGDAHRPLTRADEAAAWCECEGRHGLFVGDVRTVIGPDGWPTLQARGHQGIWNWQPSEGLVLKPVEQVNPLARIAAAPAAAKEEEAWWNR
jgi:hypothetical protein